MATVASQRISESMFVMANISLWRDITHDSDFISTLHSLCESDNQHVKTTATMIQQAVDGDYDAAGQTYAAMASGQGDGRGVSMFKILSMQADWFELVMSSGIAEVLGVLDREDGVNRAGLGCGEIDSGEFKEYVNTWPLLSWTTVLGESVVSLDIRPNLEEWRKVLFRYNIHDYVQVFITGSQHEMNNTTFTFLRNELKSKMKHFYMFFDSEKRVRYVKESDVIEFNPDESQETCYLELFMPQMTNESDRTDLEKIDNLQENLMVYRYQIDKLNMNADYTGIKILGNDFHFKQVSNYICTQVDPACSQDTIQALAIELHSWKGSIEKTFESNEKLRYLLDLSYPEPTKDLVSIIEIVSKLTGLPSVYKLLSHKPRIIRLQQCRPSMNIAKLIGDSWRVDDVVYRIAVDYGHTVIYERSIDINDD